MLLLSALTLFVVLPISALLYCVAMLLDRAVGIAVPSLAHARTTRVR